VNHASRSQLAFVLALLCSCLVPAHARAQNLVPPKLVEASQPALPSTLKLASPTFVVVEITIDAQGTVGDPSVLTSSTDRTIDELALSAAAALRFEPALRDGVAIAARIPFRFDFAASPEPPPPTPLPPVEAPIALDALDTKEKAPEPAAIVLSVRGEKPPREATSYVISRQEIRTMPGTGGDPLRAIEAMPGVGRAPFGSGDLIIRGSSPQDSAVFINGIAVPNNPYHFGGLSSVIPLEALEKMDFRPGNFGPEYGRAMGGVVDIGLRAPLKDRYSGIVQFDVIDGRLLLQGPLGKRTRALIAGRRSWLDAWYGAVMPKDQVAVKAAPVYWDGQFVLEHDLTRRTTAQIFAFGSDDKLALLIKSPDAQDPGGGGRLGAHVGFMRVGVRTQTEFTDALSWTNTAAYGPDRQDLRFGSDVFDITVQNLALRSELRARFHERITGTIGLDITGLRYDLDLYVKPYPTTDEAEGPYFARPSRRFVDKIWMFRPAAYALAEITPWHGTRLIPSVRVDYAYDTNDVTVDPRFAFRSQLHGGPYSTTLKGGVGLYQQPPQPQESVKPFGTPGVRSNRSIHSSLGLEQVLVDGLTVSLELYYKHYSKLIIARADEDNSAIGARFENTGSGRAYGSELLIKYQGNERFTGQLSYTLSRSERRNSSHESYRLFQYDQTHILSVLGTIKLGRGISFGARFRYITGLPVTPIDGGIVDLDAGAYTPVPGATYASRVPAFHQLDLRLDKTWQIKKGSLMLYVEARNTYNQKNVEGRGYQYDYAQSQKQTGLPIMPVIGLRGEL
jgi:TonB family protein